MQSIPSGTSVFLTVNLERGREYRLDDAEYHIVARFTPPWPPAIATRGRAT